MHLLRDVSAYQVMLPELLLNSAKMCPCNTEPLCVVVRCMYTSPCLRGCLMVMRARVTCHARPCDISCAPAPATHPSQGFMDILRDMTAASGTLHVIEGSTGCSVAVVNEWYVPRRWRVGGGVRKDPAMRASPHCNHFPEQPASYFILSFSSLLSSSCLMRWRNSYVVFQILFGGGLVFSSIPVCMVCPLFPHAQ